MRKLALQNSFLTKREKHGNLLLSSVHSLIVFDLDALAFKWRCLDVYRVPTASVNPVALDAFQTFAPRLGHIAHNKDEGGNTQNGIDNKGRGYANDINQ